MSSGKEQPGLLLFREDLARLDDFTNEERGRIIWALFCYVDGRAFDMFEKERDLRQIFRVMREKLDENELKYQTAKEERAIAGLMKNLYAAAREKGMTLEQEECRALAEKRYYLTHAPACSRVPEHAEEYKMKPENETEPEKKSTKQKAEGDDLRENLL